MKMVLKVKKEAADFPKAEAKAKALKAKKVVLESVHSQKKKKIYTSPAFQWHKTLHLQRQPKYPWKSTPRRNKLDHYAIKFPEYQVSHGENRRQHHTCVHHGCQVQQAPDQTGWEKALGHWHGQGQHPNQAWWREGQCSTGSWLWYFRCCQQDWDHLSGVWPAKSKLFHH